MKEILKTGIITGIFTFINFVVWDNIAVQPRLDTQKQQHDSLCIVVHDQDKKINTLQLQVNTLKNLNHGQ